MQGYENKYLIFSVLVFLFVARCANGSERGKLELNGPNTGASVHQIHVTDVGQKITTNKELLNNINIIEYDLSQVEIEFLKSEYCFRKSDVPITNTNESFFKGQVRSRVFLTTERSIIINRCDIIDVQFSKMQTKLLDKNAYSGSWSEVESDTRQSLEVSKFLDGGSRDDIKYRSRVFMNVCDCIINACDSGGDNNNKEKSIQAIIDLLDERIASTGDLSGCIDTDEQISLVFLDSLSGNTQMLVNIMSELLHLPKSELYKFENHNYDVDRIYTKRLYEIVRSMINEPYYQMVDKAKQARRELKRKQAEQKQFSVVVALRDPFEILLSSASDNAKAKEKMIGVSLLLKWLGNKGSGLNAISPFSGEQMMVVQEGKNVVVRVGGKSRDVCSVTVSDKSQ